MGKGKGVIEYSRANVVDIVAQKTKMSKVMAEAAICATLDAIISLMAQGSVDTDSAKLTLRDFGNFESRRTKERKGKNFHTGDDVVIPASRAISFKPSKGFKQAVKDAE